MDCLRKLIIWKVVELSRPVDISSMKRALAGPTIISAALVEKQKHQIKPVLEFECELAIYFIYYYYFLLLLTLYIFLDVWGTFVVPNQVSYSLRHRLGSYVLHHLMKNDRSFHMKCSSLELDLCYYTLHWL